MAPVFYTISPRPFGRTMLFHVYKKTNTSIYGLPKFEPNQHLKALELSLDFTINKVVVTFLKEWEVKICEQTVATHIKYIRSICLRLSMRLFQIKSQ